MIVEPLRKINENVRFTWLHFTLDSPKDVQNQRLATRERKKLGLAVTAESVFQNMPDDFNQG